MLRSENVRVVCAVAAQLQAIALGDHQCDFQHINRIQAQAFAIQRGVRGDLIRCDLEVQTLDHQFSNFALQLCSTGDKWLLDILHSVQTRVVSRKLQATKDSSLHILPAGSGLVEKIDAL